MSVEHAQIILDAVKERKPQFDEFINNLDVNWLRENHAHIEDEGEDSVEGWKKYFINKYDELVKFLERAIELKSTMLWSV